MRIRILALCLLSLLLAAAGAAAPAQQPAASTRGDKWEAVRGRAVADTVVTHENRSSLRVEPAGDTDAYVRSAPVRLTPGKRYELSGWVRTDSITVRDAGRTPIATGAALAMESMPFDVQSESLAGTRGWTKLVLRFTATRSEDRMVLRVGHLGTFNGKAWFEGVGVDETAPADPWPSRPAMKTFGPAYRYPISGWIYLHIEGQPYERGYQHGFLMAHEIERYLDRCAIGIDPKAKQSGWAHARTTANALFLRGFDQEILEEMKGIADGAAAAGAKWEGRPVDLLDIVTANTIVELGELGAAMPKTPTGLELLRLERPPYLGDKRDIPPTERCSAFCATGKATRDGKMVIAHITFWGLGLAEQTNVMVDVQPTTGHRVLMQSYPGGIESGTDWYQNDAGIVLTETTISQGPFNIQGTPVAYRARRAIQYSDNIDQVVEALTTRNNGLYANEWLIADAKTNEIAMFELGTYKTRLYRSARNDWFGGTEGFYWGCNNTKDLQVRLEASAPDPKGPPRDLSFLPYERDIKWQELYEQNRGRIDEQFAFLAFRTAPLVSASSMDAKVTTAEMASRMMSWAVFGKPNQREWVASSGEKEQGYIGLYSSGYRLIDANASERLRAVVADNEKARLAGAGAQPAGSAPQGTPAPGQGRPASYRDRLWKGWILPASDADLWLSAGSATYYGALSGSELKTQIERLRAEYRRAALAGEQPLASLRSDTRSNTWYRIASNKGALLLDALRRQMGDERFFALMRDFFAENTTKSVTTAQFRAAAGEQARPLLDQWLTGTGLPDAQPPLVQPPPVYRASEIRRRAASAIITYGTVAEAGANRYAAEQFCSRMLDVFENSIPIRKDFEVSDEDLRTKDVIFVGRPETNSALAAWQQRIGLEYEQAVFRVEGRDHASEDEALMFAAANPVDPKRMVLVLAGNSPVETVRLAGNSPPYFQYVVYERGKQTLSR
jgi:hypothetical protein